MELMSDVIMIMVMLGSHIVTVNSENLKNLVIFATIFRGEPRDRLTRTLVEYFITQKRT